MTAPARQEALPPLRIFWGKRVDERSLSWHLDLISSREMTPTEREEFHRLAAVVAGQLGGSIR